MTLELRPLGVSCNIACEYCYQNPQRDAGNVEKRYDMAAMKEAIEKEGGPFSLFGGEPLLMPLADLTEIWRWGYELWGRNSLQTNGTLINDDHIRLFKQYNVHVGISIDGPGELNDVRWHRSAAMTRASTAKTEAAIERLCQERLTPSLIVTLHRGNATADKLPQLFDWIVHLDCIGVRSVRLHLLESETVAVRQRYGLTNEENIAALKSFRALERELPRIRFDLFSDMRHMLLGEDERTTCIWNACDPYTTRAVRGIEGHGQRSNCGRTNKDGIDFDKADEEGFERYLALAMTPQDAGGCQGCRFFLMCKGQCPGTSIDGDWRNRTEHCSVWMTLYASLEEELLEAGYQPLSLKLERFAVQKVMMDSWARGKNQSIASVIASLRPSATPSDEMRRSLGLLRQMTGPSND
jgi:uncharacterized protein